MCQTMAHPKDSLAGPGARGGGFLWIDWTSDVRSRLPGLRPLSCACIPSPVPRRRRPACSVAPHWAVPVAGSLPRDHGGAAGGPAVNPHPSSVRMPQRVVWVQSGYPSLARCRRESALSSMAESTAFAHPGRTPRPGSGSVTAADSATAQPQIREGEGLSRNAGIGLGGAISIEGRNGEVRTWKTSA